MVTPTAIEKRKAEMSTSKKKINIPDLRLLLIACAVTIISGCASMKSNWDNCLRTNSIDAYEKFVVRYPESGYALEARVALRRLYEERDWKIALQANSIDAYEEFITRYPETAYTDQLYIKLDPLYLEEAKTINTVEAYERLLLIRPGGKLAEEVAIALKNLQSQLKSVEEAARLVLPPEAKVNVISVSRYPRPADYVISAHLLEGHSTNDANPYVRGDYGTHEKLTRLVRLRCANVLKSVFTRTSLPTEGRIIIDACHGVRQSTRGGRSSSTDVPMTIYKISMDLEKARMQQWLKLDEKAVMDLWSVDENIIPSLDFITEPGW